MKTISFVCLLLTTISLSGCVVAQDASTPPPVEPSSEEEPSAAGKSAADEKRNEDEKPKTIEEVTKDSDRVDGLFTIFRDRKTGDLRFLLREEQIGREYFYFTYTENGVPAAGHFRGGFGVFRAKVFRLQRHFDRIEFVVENTSFTYDPARAISRAAGANISHAVVADEKIEAEDAEKGVCLIKVNGLFLSESLNPVAPLPDPEKKPHEIFTLGKLNAGRSKIRTVRNYPRNTDVIVEYVFENERPYVRGGDEVTDPRAVSITVQHSLIEAPQDDFRPRYDDPRVGFFTGKITDLSSTDVIPYRDVISRWRLVKQDPSAAVSEPVEPIVFWIENTTPIELRPIIEKAALGWNEAFLAAGFKDAIVVKTQPDDADWDAGDLRYNVIRWISSPSPLFGGYGPSFSDPRTGRILGANIILEHSVIGRMLHRARVFGAASLAADDEASHDPQRCTAAMHAREAMMFGLAALDALGADSEEKQRLLEEFICFLVLHEIGHTLGLSHNFRSSFLHPLESINQIEVTKQIGLVGSVMEYPEIPFVLPGLKQGQFWTTRPGPYDVWAITFGYSTAVDEPDAEKARLETILARSGEPALAFANDADDMRRPGKAIDPRAMPGDMTSDPIGFARNQMAVVEAVVPRFKERLVRPGESYQELLNGFHTAVWRYHQSAQVASRYIGGVYVDRAMAGQAGAIRPLTPVSLEDQRRAMQLLHERIFAPDAFAFIAQAGDHLLGQRRGFDHSEITEDPKIHDVASGMQKSVLDHLLHPVVLKRITDTRTYGNDYSVAALLSDVTAAVFEDDLGLHVNTFRQNLQSEFVQRLLAIVQTQGDKGYDPVARSMAFDRLRWIQQQLGAQPEIDLETTAHRTHLLYRIARGLEETRG